jgi:hypothetical protein
MVFHVAPSDNLVALSYHRRVTPPRRIKEGA